MGRSRAATTASSSIRARISTASIPNISSAPLTRRSRTLTQSRRCAASCSFTRRTLAGGCPAVSRPPSSRTKIEALTHLPRLREKVRRSEDDAKAAAIGLMARRSPSAWLRAAFPIDAQLESYRSEWLLKDVTAGLEPDPKAYVAQSSTATDFFRNPQRPLNLRRGNRSSCPEADLPVELKVHQRLFLPGRELAKTRHPLSRALNDSRRLKVPSCWGRSKSAIRVIWVWTIRVRVCRGRIGRTGDGTADDGTRRDAGGDAAPTAPVISASVATTADVDVAVDVNAVVVAAVHVGTVEVAAVHVGTVEVAAVHVGAAEVAAVHVGAAEVAAVHVSATEVASAG